MLVGVEMIATLPLIWKRSFNLSVIIPKTIRYCTDCDKNSLCNRCNKLIYQNKEISPKLNEIKRQPPNSFGQMLPW